MAAAAQRRHFADCLELHGREGQAETLVLQEIASINSPATVPRGTLPVISERVLGVPAGTDRSDQLVITSGSFSDALRWANALASSACASDCSPPPVMSRYCTAPPFNSVCRAVSHETLVGHRPTIARCPNAPASRQSLPAPCANPLRPASRRSSRRLAAIRYFAVGAAASTSLRRPPSPR